MKVKCVIMPIKPKYLEMILNGTKTIELRKRLIRCDTKYILFYESGTKLITCKSIWLWCDQCSLGKIRDNWSSNIGITQSELGKYAGSKEELACIRLYNPCRLDIPITLDDVGLTHAPQSYVYREIDIIKLYITR